MSETAKMDRVRWIMEAYEQDFPELRVLFKSCCENSLSIIDEMSFIANFIQGLTNLFFPLD